MATASLLTFPYPYSVYPHLDGLNIAHTGKNNAVSEPSFHTRRADATNGRGYGPEGGAGYRTSDP
jgi:hypothetical protein